MIGLIDEHSSVPDFATIFAFQRLLNAHTEIFMHGHMHSRDCRVKVRLSYRFPHGGESIDSGNPYTVDSAP